MVYNFIITKRRKKPTGEKLMTQIFNTRKLNQDFGAYASNLVNFIYSNRDVEDRNIVDLQLANKMLQSGALVCEANGPGWAHNWYVNSRWLLDNGYFSKQGEELAAAGRQRHEEYFAAVDGGDLVQYYAKWGNAAGREYIIVP